MTSAQSNVIDTSCRLLVNNLNRLRLHVIILLILVLLVITSLQLLSLNSFKPRRHIRVKPASPKKVERTELSYEDFLRKDYSAQNAHTCEYGSVGLVQELLEARVYFNF